ncbi:hypothetical protein [Streptomyces sp. NPDC005209]|uniref:hypothetical protein n=1 Tax=Streptomyces sp. NPDC005209 TaxID=3156715 RepID=UPI0033BCF568
MLDDLQFGNGLMSLTPFALDDSVRDPHASIWFAVPASFIELPLGAFLAAPDSIEADALRDALAPMVRAVPDGAARQQFIGQLANAQQLLLALNEVDAVHCSLGLHRDDGEAGDGRTLFSVFIVSWRQIAWSPRVMSAARAVASGEGHVHIEYLDLPSGPATISETVRTSAAGFDVPQDPLLQVHAYLPHPDGKRMAILMLNTTATHRREQYRNILRQIAEMVSFENPLAG